MTTSQFPGLILDVLATTVLFELNDDTTGPIFLVAVTWTVEADSNFASKPVTTIYIGEKDIKDDGVLVEYVGTEDPAPSVLLV